MNNFFYKKYISAAAVLTLVVFFGLTKQEVKEVQAVTAPELPRVYMDTTYPTLSGSRTVYSVKTNCSGTSNCFTSLQTAINTAAQGDEIVVQAGMEVVGPIVLKNKTTGSGWIVIRTSDMTALPAAGVRVNPSNSNAMPKIVSTGGNSSTLTVEDRAHNYRLVGIEFKEQTPNDDSNVLVSLGRDDSFCGTPQSPYIVCTDQSLANNFASNIVLDRTYIHGSSTHNVKRGLALNSKSNALIDSYISDIHVVGQDSQALSVAYGPGPFKIVNNYLEASTENVLFGGDDPRIQYLVPSDIEFRKNYLSKPLSWNINDPSTYAGKHWDVKNLFELKNAQRVLVDGNIMENNWVDGQTGYAVLFTVRNQEGACTWCVVQDVTFQNNIVRHTAQGLNLLGHDNSGGPSALEQRIKIYNNVWEDVGATKWGGVGKWLVIVGGTTDPGPADTQIIHNTIFQTSTFIAPGDFYPGTGTANTKPNTVITDNIALHNDYGVLGDSSGIGNLSLNTYFPGVVFTKNILMGGPANSYSQYPNNYFPTSWNSVFVNQAAGNYHVLSTSPYHNAGTDGKDLGADVDVIVSLTGNVISGNNPNPNPTPSPAPTPTPPPTDTTAPVVASFDVLPHVSSGPVTANFTVTDSGGSLLQRVELWRAIANPVNCTQSNTSACFWVQTASIDTPAANSWASTTTESPALGNYLYGIHVADRAGNTAHEAAVIAITIGAPLVGDINLDHIVNSIDFSILNSHWLSNHAASDLNHDGLVNSLDYSLLNANWFKTW
jgi:hypothetical protein